MQNVAMASEFRYKCEIFENGQWQSVIGAQLPFFIAKTLDESLDSGKMVIGATTRKEPFKPFTPVRFLTAVNRINALEHNRAVVAPDFSKYKPIYMLISTDNITRNGIYFKHEIELVELSKLLERDVCDTLTFTNALATNSDIGNTAKQDIIIPTDAQYDLTIKDTSYQPPSQTIKNLTYYIESIEDLFGFTNSGGWSRQWMLSSFTELIYPSGKSENINYSANRYIYIEEIGKYNVNYHCDVMRYGSTGQEFAKWIISFDFEVVEGQIQKPSYSITSVINRVLSAGVTRREGLESQKYKLDEAVAERYKDVIAPEFYITRSNLFEALMQVGAFIHAIPRLVWNEETDKPDTITFDELGSGEEYLLPEYCRMQGFLGGLDAEGYCGSLDSIVENIITTTDAEQGSITEPDYNAFKTMRTEEGTWRISNDTAIFSTDFPIYRVIKFEMGYVDRGWFVGEIVPFVYEKSEYETLTSYNGEFPYAKEFALVYTQGQHGISAFEYKSENAIDPYFSSPTLENILEKLGVELKFEAANYKNLAFRITYIPIATSRVKQYKASKDFPLDNSLIFNQSANTVETEFYGEHLKGTIARIGNETTKETYYFRFPTDMPEAGQIYDDKYIVATETQYDQIGITCTMTLTPNYNKLSEFLGLNSNYRLFDVSEKQSVDRYINYSEICEIGDDVPADTDAGITSAGVQTFADTFTQAAGHYPVSVSLTQGLTKDKTPIESLILHASTSSAIGNSLAFTWSYKDNYGAGFKSVFMSSTQNTQALVPYGDVYGELYYLSLRLGANIKTSNWSDQLSSATSPGWSNNLPIFTGEVPSSGIYFDYSGKPLIIQKDSRENIAVTSQLHFVANRRGIVIGTALSHNNLLVTRANAARAARVVFLPYKLNALNGKPDLSGAAFGAMPSISVDAANKKIVIGSVQNRTSQTFKSWALIDPANGTVYLGENTELAPNASTAPIVMTFKSNKN